MNTDRPSVAEIAHDTLHAFWCGKRESLTAYDVVVIKDLVKAYARLTARSGDASSLPCLPVDVAYPDDADLARLAHLMGQQEWTPRELRELALQHGLFNPWLTSEDSSAIHARFGRLCENAAGREFPDGVFLVRGEDRKRRYLVRPGASTSSDWSI